MKAYRVSLYSNGMVVAVLPVEVEDDHPLDELMIGPALRLFFYTTVREGAEDRARKRAEGLTHDKLRKLRRSWQQGKSA